MGVKLVNESGENGEGGGPGALALNAKYLGYFNLAPTHPSAIPDSV